MRSNFFIFFLKFLLNSSLYLSIASLAMLYNSIELQSLSHDIRSYIIMFFVTLFVYSLNRLTDVSEDAGTYRSEFSPKKNMLLLAIGGYLVAIIVAFSRGIFTFFISIVPIILGVLYSVKFLPSKFKYRRLKDIPIIKSIVISLSWAITATFLPYTRFYLNFITVLVFFLFFVRVFTNCTSLDIDDIESDLRSGVKTLPAILGEKTTKVLLTTINFISIVVVSVLILFSSIPKIFIVFPCSAIYNHFYITLKKGKRLIREILADGQCIFTFLLLIGYSQIHL